MLQKKKVVITGFSVCAPNGIGAKDFENNTLLGISGCRELDTFKVPSKFSNVAGMVSAFYPETLFSYEQAKSFNHAYKDRQHLFAEYCIAEALSIAGLKETNARPYRDISLVLATAIGPMTSMEYAFIAKNYQSGQQELAKMSVFSFRNYVRDLAKTFDLTGLQLAIPTGCVGGCDAITYATNSIRMGKSECIIVGASEAPITPLTIAAFGQIKATSMRHCLPHEASCPFDSDRDGFVLGEGCGILILESEESANTRGAKIYAEIKGVGSTNNCFHMTDIASDGFYIKESSRLAIEDAALLPDQIDYVNAHGSSTKQNDLAEANAFTELFGDRATQVPVTSIKSQIGHALAAANAIEMVSVVQTINNHKIPPTINLNHQDENIHLRLVKNKYLTHGVKNVLKTSSGFSGIHTSIVIGKYEGDLCQTSTF